MAESDNQKQIFSIGLRDDVIALLPSKVRGILAALAGERNILVKGGIARLCLMVLIEKKGKLEGRDRFAIEKRIGDIDLAFWHDGRSADFRAELSQRYLALAQKLSSAGVIFEPKNIDIISPEAGKPPVEIIFNTTDL